MVNKQAVSSIRLSNLMLFLFLIMLLSLSSSIFAQRTTEPHRDAPGQVATIGGIPTDQWVVELAPGIDAAQIATTLGFQNLGRVGSLTNTYVFEMSGRSVRDDALTRTLASTPGIVGAEQQFTSSLVTRQITDPLFPDQWHLENTGQRGGTAGEDVNILPIWDAGITGDGVVVASVDDGVWIDSPDLGLNLNSALHYDFVDDDSDPSAGAHGTSVAGVMAASADGTECGVGAAYEAEIAGIRLLDLTTTPAMEAAALSHKLQDIDIYNNSWGPPDDGIILQPIPPLVETAIVDGVTNGRGGLGTIYVWAAGNGGYAPIDPDEWEDNINADGYANSIYTIAVGASNDRGELAWYSEPGASMLINAPSNDDFNNLQGGITTTDGPGFTGYNETNCTADFGGTSSSSPLAAGIIALMLEANPNLNWRDVQHILIKTAEQNDPSHPEWSYNAAGHLINHRFGFGRIDAEAAVEAAQTWTNVDAHVSATIPPKVANAPIPEDGTYVSSQITVTDNIKLEHVEIVLNATHNYRGDIEVELISPDGTVSRMMYGRLLDNGIDYEEYKMMTVRHWDEYSAGEWTLRLRDITPDESGGTFDDWSLILWGTDLGDDPAPEPFNLVSPGTSTEPGEVIVDPTTITEAVWEIAVGASDYTFTLTKPDATTNVQNNLTAIADDDALTCTNQCTLTLDHATLLDQIGTYRWTVSAFSTGDEETVAANTPAYLTIAVDEPVTFSLLSPADGMLLRDKFELETFTWTHVSNALLYTFDLLYISENTGRLGVLANVELYAPDVCAANTCRFDVTPDFITDNLSEGLYGWTVTASDGIKDVEAEDGPFLFTIHSGDIEFVRNGGFEQYNDEDKQPDAWDVKALDGGDKIKCNKILEDGTVKTKAYSGECAYQFKGAVGANPRIQQKVTDADFIVPGDTLDLSLWVKAKASAANIAVAKIVVTYNTIDAETGKPNKDKRTLRVPEIPSGEYEPLNTSLNITDGVNSLKVQLRYRGSSGKVFLDNVSVILPVNSGTPLDTLIPLPEAPDTFRR